ncbi:MAG: hypothetical protein ABR548_04475 [Actinomycetota bacterium]|nr:hypothetical protein [Actinomycetota bacterium]
MTLGLRNILLMVAIVLFVIAAFDGSSKLLYFGLAAFAGAFLVGDMPMGRRICDEHARVHVQAHRSRGSGDVERALRARDGRSRVLGRTVARAGAR